MAEERQVSEAAGRLDGRLLFSPDNLRACLLCKQGGATGAGVVEHVWSSAKDPAPVSEQALLHCARKVVAGHLFAAPDKLVQRPVVGQQEAAEPFLQINRSEGMQSRLTYAVRVLLTCPQTCCCAPWASCLVRALV